MTIASDDVYDVVVVGGGPAGLSAAMMLGRSRRRIVVVDAGQPRNASAAEFHGYLGRDSTSPLDLLRDGRRELAKYSADVIPDNVTAAEKSDVLALEQYKTFFTLRTRSGQTIHTRKILFCTGMRDKLPELPGLQACYGHSVHHCPYCDGWEHRDQRLIAYGEDAGHAAGLGLLLRCWSHDVTVLTNGHPVDQEHKDRLIANGVTYSDEAIDRLVYNDRQLRAVQFREGRVLAADALFFQSGRSQKSTLSTSLGCELADDESNPTDRKLQTNVPGVYVAGDAAGEIQFVIVAAAEGATAAVAINRELQEEDLA